MQLPPSITQEFLDRYKLKPTGSRYVGGATEDSDYDFFGLDTAEVRKGLLALGFEDLTAALLDQSPDIIPTKFASGRSQISDIHNPSGYGLHHKVWHLDGVHVLLFSEARFAEYDRANEWIRETPWIKDVDKQIRIKLFQLLTGRL